MVSDYYSDYILLNIQVNPCKHNATCEDKTDDFFCKCNIGYMGKMCQEEINECDPGNICHEQFQKCNYIFIFYPDPCINRGECQDLVGDYRCNCKPGYEGRNCEININEERTQSLIFKYTIYKYKETKL